MNNYSPTNGNPEEVDKNLDAYNLLRLNHDEKEKSKHTNYWKGDLNQ